MINGVSTILTRGIDRNSQFMINARKKGKAEVAKRCNDLKADIERRCDDEVVFWFKNDREDYRRRGGKKLLGSFQANVIADDSDTPVRIVLRSTAMRGDIDLGRMLNAGTRPHTINARNKQVMVFPINEFNHGDGIWRAKKVNHPGSKRGAGFMQKSLDQAVDAAFGAAIRRSARR